MSNLRRASPGHAGNKQSRRKRTSKARVNTWEAYHLLPLSVRKAFEAMERTAK